uniref:DUF7869 domain-containing protein n=1 Tax=Zeugodacus cucurbitae TaxID=28588 RepID=A0A0A1XN62_ZEUCU
MVRSWLSSSELYSTQLGPENKKNLQVENRRNTIREKTYQDRLNYLIKWLEDIPKLESHYRRQYTNKLYFQSEFKSYANVYEVYSRDCKSHNANDIAPISFPNFMKFLNTNNLSIFKPRNDMCNTCISFESKNISVEQYDVHRKDIREMREEKNNDIESTKAGLCSLLCMDMQAVKLIPQSKANASYYKMKLQVHNFTIYNVITHKSDNYVWDETEGSLVASTFATIVIKHIKKEILNTPNIHHFIIYSDGCFYQNRNAVLSNALISFCVVNHITIEHKYLVVGHTQMECDSTHSLIQRKMNNKQINLPSQLVQLMKDARKNPYPLVVHHLQHSYFLDYENLPKRYSSIRPGNKVGDPTVNMIRALAYDTTGSIYYKTCFKDEYQLLPKRTTRNFEIQQPNLLHPQRLTISKKKWQHLQDLKALIPADCHYFYDNIPFE